MRTFRFLTLVTLVLCFCVVVFGAYVRLSDAGLGCPDWPGCYGHLTVPEADHEVSAAQAAYPHRPVEAHKAWKEMIHRYLASSLGLLIIGIAVLAYTLRDIRIPRRLSWLLVPLVVFQGVLGMWTVTWQLKPLAVTGHLLGGMTTLCLLFWLWLSVRGLPSMGRDDGADDSASPRVRELRSERDAAFTLAKEPSASSAPPPPAGIRALAAVALIVVAVQVFLGGWTSTNYAALACPDFPTCQNVWVPDHLQVREAYTLWRGLGTNYEYGVLDSRARITIHYFHRIGAVVVTVLLIGLGAWLLRRGPTPGWRRAGGAILAALALQLGIGIAIVKLQLPLLLAAAHNAGAAVLLLTLVFLNHYARRT